MDGTMRIWPRAGGLYDQDYVDLQDFAIIERRIAEKQKLESKKRSKPSAGPPPAMPVPRGPRS